MTRPATVDELLAASRCVLADAAGIATIFLQTHSDYARVGGHLRHVIEHYCAFVKGVGQGTIHYDRRERDAAIESDPRSALAALATLNRELATLVLDPATTLQVALYCPVAGAETVAGSSAGRELQFLISHAIHHYALLRPTLQAVSQLPHPDFGYAPSTLRHARETAI